MNKHLELWENFTDDIFPNWYMVYKIPRHAGHITESNFKALLTRVGGESETVRIIDLAEGGMALYAIFIREDDENSLRIADDCLAEIEEHQILDEDLAMAMLNSPPYYVTLTDRSLTKTITFIKETSWNNYCELVKIALHHAPSLSRKEKEELLDSLPKALYKDITYFEKTLTSCNSVFQDPIFRTEKYKTLWIRALEDYSYFIHKMFEAYYIQYKKGER